MSAGAWWSPKDFLPHSGPSSPYRVTWTHETFKKSDDAEASLCEDRAAFVLRNDIMALIPGHITKYMIHSNPEARVRGFQELFLYLNEDPSPAPLRQLIHAYFNDCPSLRGHLSQSSLIFSNDTILKKTAGRPGVDLPRNADEDGTNMSVSDVVLSQNNSSLSDGADLAHAASPSGRAGDTSARISDGATGSAGRLQDMANIDGGQASQKGALLHTPSARLLCLTAFLDSEHPTLNLLPHADAASWDPSLVCHRETRKEILDDIMGFLTAPDDASGLRIFLLTGVSGCGKTAIAHTVAKTCAQSEDTTLGSSFSLSEGGERRRPDKLFSIVARDICSRDKIFCASVCDVIAEERALASAPLPRQFDGLILKPAKDAAPYRTQPLTIVIDALDEGYNKDLLGILRDTAALVPRKFRFFITSRNDATIIPRLHNLNHIALKEVNIRDNVNRQDVAIFVTHRLKEIARDHNIENWPDDNSITKFNHQAEGLFVWAVTACNHIDASTSPMEELDDLLNNKDLLDPHAAEKMDKLYASILSKCPWHDRHFVWRYQPCLGAVVALKRPLSTSAIEMLLDDDNAHTVFRPLCSLLIGAMSRDRPVQIAPQSLRDYVTRCNQGQDYADVRFAISEIDHSQHLALRCIIALNHELPKHRNSVSFIFDEDRDTGSIPSAVDGVIPEHVWYACEHWIDHLQDVRVVSDELQKQLADFVDRCLLIWMAVCATKKKYFGIGKFYGWSKVLPQIMSFLWEILMFFQGLEEQRIAMPNQTTMPKVLRMLALDFKHMGQLEEALEAAREDVALMRDLARDQPNAFNPDLARSLNNLSNPLSDLGHREEALEAMWECVPLYRDLVRDWPNAFNLDLARSLNNFSICLSDLGHREEALQAAQECVALYRNLAQDRPNTFRPELARSLNNFSIHLADLGHWEEALEAVRECVALRRDLAQDQPNVFNPDLAGSLHTLSNRLSNLGHREEALEVVRESVALYRDLARDRPNAFNPDLACSLNILSVCLSNLGHREDALEAVQECVALYRDLARNRPNVFNPDLAHSLNNLSIYLPNLDDREKALEAVRECVALYRDLARDRPNAFAPDLALSLNNFSNRLSDLGHREEALAAVQECVALRRDLARDRPNAFNPDLALSLNTISNHLSDLGHQEEALTAVQECVALYRDLAQDRPNGFNPYLALSLNNFSNRLSDLGHQEEALDAVREYVALYRGLASDRRNVFNPDLARSLNNFSNRLSDLGHREEALEAARESAALRRDLAQDRPNVFEPDLARSLNNFSNRLSDLNHREEALEAVQECVALYRDLAQDRPNMFNPDLAVSLNNLSNCLSELGHQEEALEVMRESAAARPDLAQN